MRCGSVTRHGTAGSRGGPVRQRVCVWGGGLRPTSAAVRPCLMLNVTFSSSFCGLRSTTSSVTVLVDKKDDSSCVPQGGWGGGGSSGGCSLLRCAALSCHAAVAPLQVRSWGEQKRTPRTCAVITSAPHQDQEHAHEHSCSDGNPCPGECGLG